MGPTPRAETGGESWRPAMLAALKEAGYDGVVYVPETEDGKWKHSYEDQIEWEQQYLNQCDRILAWVDRDLKRLPGFTTNVEFGEFVSSGKLLYGHPERVPKIRYLNARYQAHGGTVLKKLTEMADAAVGALGEGAERTGGQREVPLEIWRSKQFQAWHDELVHAGNRLDGAKVLWAFRVGPKKSFLFSFALHVKVWVAAEERHKENEYVFSRTDIAAIVPYRMTATGPEVVLIKEYRATGRTKDGFVHELPGGSSFKEHLVPTQVASEELAEETGIKITPKRFRLVSTRQVGATISSHRAYVFAVELTEEEMAQAKKMDQDGTRHGVLEDTEITYVEVRTLDEILTERLVDWSNVGMIMETLHSLEKNPNGL